VSLTDATGVPVTTVTTAEVAVEELSCKRRPARVRWRNVAGPSEPQNLSKGDYRLDWKVPASYANICKTLQLDLGEGSGPRTAASSSRSSTRDR
jgi:hypothetical protein